jgi:hypothetical protein
MNYRYVPEHDLRLKQILARNPKATLHEIRRSLPNSASMSLDHIALRVERMVSAAKPAR